VREPLLCCGEVASQKLFAFLSKRFQQVDIGGVGHMRAAYLLVGRQPTYQQVGRIGAPTVFAA